MASDGLAHEAGSGSLRRRDRLIGAYIGLLAVGLAICNMGGGNAAKDANVKNIEVTNTWAFFQAKNIRRQVLRMQIDEFELRRAEAELPESAKASLDAAIASYKAQDAALTSDPKSGEGLDELYRKGKALEVERDRAMRRDPYFDYGEACLQIAIVLASVSIISGGSVLLVLSALLGATGMLLAVNGFTLAVALPLLG